VATSDTPALPPEPSPKRRRTTRARVSLYVYIIIDDEAETTFRGALVDNDYDVSFLRLEGAEIAVRDAKTNMQDWIVPDGPVVIYADRVKYMIEAPPPR